MMGLGDDPPVDLRGLGECWSVTEDGTEAWCGAARVMLTPPGRLPVGVRATFHGGRHQDDFRSSLCFTLEDVVKLIREVTAEDDEEAPGDSEPPIRVCTNHPWLYGCAESKTQFHYCGNPPGHSGPCRCVVCGDEAQSKTPPPQERWWRVAAAYLHVLAPTRGEAARITGRDPTEVVPADGPPK